LLNRRADAVASEVELLNEMNQPKLAYILPSENDAGNDEPPDL